MIHSIKCKFLPSFTKVAHDIILIESFTVNLEDDLEIVAILENVGKREATQDVPSLAPVRARATVFKELLPYGVTFTGKRSDELEELVNRHNLLCNQQWKVITDPEPQQRQGRLFF